MRLQLRLWNWRIWFYICIDCRFVHSFDHRRSQFLLERSRKAVSLSYWGFCLFYGFCLIRGTLLGFLHMMLIVKGGVSR